MIEQAAHRGRGVDVLGVADEIDPKHGEPLERRNEDAQRTCEPIVLPNQNTIESPAVGILHEFSICPIVLMLRLPPFGISANVVDIFLINFKSTPGGVFTQGEQLHLWVLFACGDARVDGNHGRFLQTIRPYYSGPFIIL